MNRLAVVTTHPIQYYAPLFKVLVEQGIILKVFYTWGQQSATKYDPGFKQRIQWDLPLLVGYNYEYLINSSSNPGSSNFLGILNPEAVEKIELFDPCCIMVFGWSYHSHLSILRHFKGKRHVWFRGDSTLLDIQKGFTGRVHNLARSIFLRWIYSHVDKAFYVGSNNRKYFLKYGLTGDQLIFSPHSIDNDRFAVSHDEESGILRQKLKIGKNDVALLFAGKFEEKKDPLLLLAAFKAVNCSNLHLIFVGNGPLEEQLKSSASQTKLHTRIHFLDFQNQSKMPIIYQACDVFCLPSKGPGETWGLSVNEAMACGKAIISSDKVGCSADLIKENVNGYTFKAGSINDLAKKIKSICDREKSKAFGNKSAEIIKEWSFDHTVKNIINEVNNEIKR